MKKILCFMIVATMLISVLGVTANATTIEELALEFFDYCGGNEMDWSDPDRLATEGKVTIYEYVETENAVFFSGVTGWMAAADMECVRKFGDWYIYSPVLHYHSDSGIYVKIEDDIYPLDVAWENGLVTNLSCIEGFSELSKVYRIGDVDLDFDVSVLDATLIQLKVAELEKFDYLQTQTADVDGDSEVSVLDATAIQLELAELV